MNSCFRVVFVAASIVAAVAGIAGCSSQSPEDAYWENLSESSVSQAAQQMGRDDALQLGYMICANFQSEGRQAGSLTAMQAMEGAGMTTIDATMILGSASLYLCPN